ncbi:MAG: PIG-L family deacetylase [Armatimonadetes bacterium]|nr:PIG-L family deacetylase [Armatimonadota bacterium]
MRSKLCIGFLAVVVFFALFIPVCGAVLGLHGPEAASPVSLVPSDRLLVVAPHPDDEVIGCGGLLWTALQKGCEVRVLYITNGDGYWHATERVFKRVFPRETDFISLGNLRREEAIAALSRLEVPQDQAVFLGFPNGGMDRLWGDFWSPERLYRSPHTRQQSSPYPYSYRSKAPYCGSELWSEIIEILGSWRPTSVVLPHPQDTHPDHWATAAFLDLAVEGLHQGSLGEKIPQRFYYMVHRGKWPAPYGYDPVRTLSPPKGLEGLGLWTPFPLAEEAVVRKRSALEEYRSQLRVSSKFLMSFVAKGELFCEFPEKKLPLTWPQLIEVDGRTEDWAGLDPLSVEPTQDNIVGRLESSGDFSAIWGCDDSENLYLRLDTQGPISSRTLYTVFLKIVNPDTAVYPLMIQINGRRVKCSISSLQVKSAFRSNHLELSVPLTFAPRFRTDLASSQLISVQAFSSRYVQVDHTAPLVLHRATPVSTP